MIELIVVSSELQQHVLDTQARGEGQSCHGWIRRQGSVRQIRKTETSSVGELRISGAVCQVFNHHLQNSFLCIV